MSVSHSHQFMVVRDLCTFFNVSAHRVSGRPFLLSPNLTSDIDIACGHLRWSVLAIWPHKILHNIEAYSFNFR